MEPNAADKDGNTLLNRAGENGNADVVAVLVDAGADSNKVNKDGPDLAALCRQGRKSPDYPLADGGGRRTQRRRTRVGVYPLHLVGSNRAAEDALLGE